MLLVAVVSSAVMLYYAMLPYVSSYLHFVATVLLIKGPGGCKAKRERRPTGTVKGLGSYLAHWRQGSQASVQLHGFKSICASQNKADMRLN